MEKVFSLNIAVVGPGAGLLDAGHFVSLKVRNIWLAWEGKMRVIPTLRSHGEDSTAGLCQRFRIPPATADAICVYSFSGQIGLPSPF